MTDYESCRRWLKDRRDPETCEVFLNTGKSIETILIEEIDRLNEIIYEKETP